MVKFIEHHKNDETIFWPDLASCHYAKQTLKWMKQKNIKIVPKADSPLNVSQARPIENFWALLARAIYAKGWEAKNEAELCGRIKMKLKVIDVSVVKTMMRDRWQLCENGF
jgi:hypothetical protein